MKTATESWDNSGAIAVIGMAGCFPGARSISEFWRNLSTGVEAISFFSEAELKEAGVSAEVYSDPAYVGAKGVVAGVEMFDASFFGFTPAEAALMDPQQRLFLQCAWEALENAGYDFAAGGARTGVYAGSAMSTYLLFNLLSNPDLFETVSPLQVRIMNDKDFLTTLVSYKLNLKGPSIAVQTACSTSLVAVHLAAQGLLDGECDLALAGGVAVSFPQKSGYMYTEGGIWSPDGHCRAFDAEAQGTVEGNGAGVVVLKRYEDAVADRDFIHALIKGSAINNDGSLKAGYTAPSIESQTQVVLEALALSGVEAGSVTYVEAHGSATPLGDPIEVQALTKAFRSQTEKKNFCALGSVKSSVGHLDNAAGMASLIKTVEALKHKVIPPTLHFRYPNPRMDLPNSPFYVNTSAIEWNTNGLPRRAGVSSLGIGGTNAHVIVEEAPELVHGKDSLTPSYQLIPLSAKTEAALEQATANLANYLREHPEIELADACYTLQVGRRAFNHRRMLVCSDRADALALLESRDPHHVLTGVWDQSEPDVVMMFPGLGDHEVEMGAALYREQRTFREQVDYCAGLLKPLIGLDLREVLYPQGTPAKKSDVNKRSHRDGFDLRKMLAKEEAPAGPLSKTSIAQPAVFVIEYALAQLMMSWGIRPQALVGYSIGEYVAACLAGVFSLDDAIALVAARAALIEQLPSGAMLAIPLAEDELTPLLKPGLSLCASNGPALSVVGGPHELVTDLEQQLIATGVACRWLRTSHAFHSQMMDSIVEPFSKQVSRIQLKAPQLPFISNVTGTWITAVEATDPNYWASHLRQTVRFGEGVRELLKKPNRVMLEIGPGQALTTLVRQHAEKRTSQLVVSSMSDRRDEGSDVEFLLTSLGRLWLAGVRIDWQGFNAQQSRFRVPLPAYPFQRERYWIEPGNHSFGSPRPGTDRKKKANLDDWTYLPVWKRARAAAPASTPSPETRWLIFLDEAGLGAQVARRLTELGAVVVGVRTGEHFETIDHHNYTIKPGERKDYDALIRELRDSNLLPAHVVHLWSVTPDISNVTGIEAFDAVQEKGFYSLLFLGQAFGEHEVTGPLQVGIVSNNLFEVTGEEQCCSSKATICGPAKVIPQEYPKIICRNIDVMFQGSAVPALADQIINELLSDTPDKIVAYRGRHRWVRSFEANPLATSSSRVLREAGTYLITGADEEIGLVLAEELARSAKAKLALIASPEFPARDKWETWLSAHDDQDEVSRKVRRLRALEIEMPESELLFLPADVTSQTQMQAALSATLQRFGALNGVIHAANVQSPGIIQLKTSETAAGVLAPKTKGTLILASLIDEIPLDFFALFSSTVSIAGGFGQVDSCAANAFLDAFANQRTLETGAFTVAINWSAFQWDQWLMPAMATPELQEQLQQNLIQNGISARESVQLFKRIIGDTSSQVIVCPQDLDAVIEQTDSFTFASFLEVMKTPGATGKHPRPAMAVPYVEPRNEVEQTIASMWQESFGIAQVGVEDNFFDLDGNSLLAIQIVTRMRRVFEIDLPMTSLFDAPTISQLARKVQELKYERTDDAELEKILSEIEMLSLDEARRKFAEEQ